MKMFRQQQIDRWRESNQLRGLQIFTVFLSFILPRFPRFAYCRTGS